MASPFENSGEERTEQASSYRREEFRKQGTVALSRELVSVVLLIGVGAGFYGIAGSLFSEFSTMAKEFFSFSQMKDLGRDGFLDLRVGILRHWAWMAGPIMGIALVAGVVACVGQVGVYFTLEPLSPDWDRINPLNGFQRIFSSKGGVEALKAVLKMAVVIFVVYSFFKGQLTSASQLLGLGLSESFSVMLSALGRLFFSLVLSLSLISVLDYVFQRYQLEKQMKMTKREAKEEFKLREGDPLMKARIRSIQRKMASRRMMEDVPKSDVVITNPTHLAIALQYDPTKMAAPKVIAKGAGVVAQKIKEVARFHQIPCVENKPLARAIYKQLDINEYIPRELYKAVAEVLAYVYRLKGRLNNG